jgi:oligopeptide/dipeptide ABC transporter ATP-binding protein
LVARVKGWIGLRRQPITKAMRFEAASFLKIAPPSAARCLEPNRVATLRRGQRIILAGDVPSPSNPPSGCRFHTRCPYVFDRCKVDEPALRQIADGQFAACHLNDLPAAQNPMMQDSDLLPGAPARGLADGADTARSRAAP